MKNKRYKTSADIKSFLNTLQANNSSLCEWLSSASHNHVNNVTTVDGKIIDTLKISKDLSASSPNASTRASVLIVSGLHAREWAPPDAVCSFFENLLNSYKNEKPIINKAILVSSPKPDPDVDMTTDPFEVGEFTIPFSDIKRIIENLDIYVCPCLNPDGRDFSLQELNLSGLHKRSQTRFYRDWRTNRSNNPDTSGNMNFNGNQSKGLNTPPYNERKGTDIGRNFDIVWNFEDYYSSSIPFINSWEQLDYPSWILPLIPFDVDILNNPITDNNSNIIFEQANNYRGNAKESEMETIYLAKLLRNTNLNISYFLDLHSASGAILLPWSFVGKSQSNDNTKTWWNHSLDSEKDPLAPAPDEMKPPIQDRKSGTGSRNENFEEYQYPTLSSLTKYIANKISDGITAGKKPDSRAYKRAEYKVGTAKERLGYLGSGSPLDYFHSLNYPFPGNPRSSNVFPLFSFVMEAGRASDGNFHPNKKEYEKVEREIHLALYNFLAMAANWRNQFTFAKP